MPLQAPDLPSPGPGAPMPRADGDAADLLPVWQPRGWVAAVLLLTPVLYVMAWPGGMLDLVLPRPAFLALHNLLEVTAVVVSMMVALTAAYVLDERERPLGRAMTVAFMVVAGVDLLHMVSYAGMPDLVSPNTSHKAIVLWLLARGVAAGALLVWCFPWPPGFVGARAAALLTMAGAAISVLLGTLAVWRPEAFPSTFEPGLGLTPLKQAAEGMVMLLLGLALAGQLKRMAGLRGRERADEEPVRDAILLLLLGEVFFVLYGEQVTTGANLLGHVYKVLAYGCLYRSVFLHRVRRPYLRLRHAQREVEQRSAEYEELLELAPVGVVVTDAQGRICLANRALEAMFGHTRGELVGQSVEVLLPEGLRQAHQGHRGGWIAAGLPGVRLRGGLQGQRKDGTLLDVEISIEKTHRAEGWRLTACVSDVSHRRAHEAALEHRATHDLLTGLPNRWRFTEELRRAVAQAAGADEVLGVVVLDLAGFKQANERHGHAVADALLQEVARALVAAAPPAFLARLGGDVFGVVARGVGPGAPLAALAQRLAAALAPGVRAGAVEWPGAAAMGLASYPADARDAEQLLRCADVALDEAKQRGRAQVVAFDAGLGRRAQQALRVRARLQAALQEDALVPHYQPQVEVASGRVQGFEALVRWTDPELGEVAPAVFIPIAENAGLIGALGEAVLRRACRQLRAWREAGLHTRVAVNLSPWEFRHPGLVARIARELARHGLPGECLAVEITESAVIDDFPAVAEQLRALVELGVEVHLDDFGTGHSSLAWLKAFPIATIKIDRSFVRDMVRDANDEAIVRAVVGLGHTLGCSIVAEGVEHGEQLERLRALRCEAYQGWLFSPALPEAEATALLRRSCEPEAVAE
ncbi:bifunctional diguanylate cyclase/phosphodiesterase [Azohydromonas caseinilytica]|uniref:EAL domain-containing protein n=1 Tax=Azohydromonas caseinilytica TaxID=2728836 RepID=A0A848FC18_9BURK|nr:EAL domain-containing protein [Azohydromonas caseinilytica]NML15969.1 EAL domain-containing protein [Azohydromonas caseinilytica]